MMIGAKLSFRLRDKVLSAAFLCCWFVYIMSMGINLSVFFFVCSFDGFPFILSLVLVGILFLLLLSLL